MGNREGYVVGILFYRLDKKASLKKKFKQSLKEGGSAIHVI